jgi:hypothetical protein
VWGFNYELLVLGLWSIIAKEEDCVKVGKVSKHVWFTQGKRKMFCLKGGIEKECMS